MEQRPTLIGLGANLGDPPAQLRGAVHAIRSWPELRGWRCSSLYRGAFVGSGAAQPEYFNALLEIDCPLEPQQIFDRLRALEAEIEGAPRAHQAPRRLDLDLLLVGEVRMDGPELVLPHPRMRGRRFVLEPLVELCPKILLPPDSLSARALLALPRIQSQELYRVESAARWSEETKLCLP